MIPRATVAAALGLSADTDALPPGDLPLDRFAARLIGYLSAPAHDADTPDAWTGAVMDALISDDPALALAAILAGLDHPGAEALADPLAELAEAGQGALISDAAEDLPALQDLIARANAAS